MLEPIDVMKQSVRWCYSGRNTVASKVRAVRSGAYHSAGFTTATAGSGRMGHHEQEYLAIGSAGNVGDGPRRSVTLPDRRSAGW